MLPALTPTRQSQRKAIKEDEEDDDSYVGVGDDDDSTAELGE